MRLPPPQTRPSLSTVTIASEDRSRRAPPVGRTGEGNVSASAFASSGE